MTENGLEVRNQDYYRDVASLRSVRKRSAPARSTWYEMGISESLLTMAQDTSNSTGRGSSSRVVEHAVTNSVQRGGATTSSDDDLQVLGVTRNENPLTTMPNILSWLASRAIPRISRAINIRNDFSPADVDIGQRHGVSNCGRSPECH